MLTGSLGNITFNATLLASLSNAATRRAYHSQYLPGSHVLFLRDLPADVHPQFNHRQPNYQAPNSVRGSFEFWHYSGTSIGSLQLGGLFWQSSNEVSSSPSPRPPPCW